MSSTSCNVTHGSPADLRQTQIECADPEYRTTPCKDRAVSNRWLSQQRQIEFHTRPVFMRPEFVVVRSKRIQQCTDARSGSRDRPLMKVTHYHGPDPGMKSTKAQVARVATTAAQCLSRITTSAPRARSPSASGRRTCGTERRKKDRVYRSGCGPCRWWRRIRSFCRRRAVSAPIA